MKNFKKTIFVMMPFDNNFIDVWFLIKRTIENITTHNNISVEFECNRLDEIKCPGNIITDMMNRINDADICIADVTGGNANVMFEVGYAYGQKKPVILLNQNSATAPFDIFTDRQIIYDRNNLSQTLSIELKQFIHRIIDNMRIQRPEAKTLKIGYNQPISIAVTGSMKLDTNTGEDRVKVLLSPYTQKGVVWYVGSYGDADELAVEYLSKMGEKVAVVGYTQYDLSSKMLDLINKYNLPYIDVSKEQVVKTIVESPSDRDTYLKEKVNLSIYLWNGTSATTKKNIDWSVQIKKDFIIGFIPK